MLQFLRQRLGWALALLLFAVVGFAGEGATLRATIAGAPGELVTIERAGLTVEAATPGTPSSEELAVAPGESVTATWVSHGVTVVVTIVPQPGESDDGVTIRLAKRVNAMQKSFPPDQPAPQPGG